jgi:hypothetical protein
MENPIESPSKSPKSQGKSRGNMHDFRATALSDAGESGYSASLPRYCARSAVGDVSPRFGGFAQDSRDDQVMKMVFLLPLM